MLLLLQFINYKISNKNLLHNKLFSFGSYFNFILSFLLNPFSMFTSNAMENVLKRLPMWLHKPFRQGTTLNMRSVIPLGALSAHAG